MKNKIIPNALLAFALLAGISHASLVLHSTLDNVDVGAGFGADSTQAGAFAVVDSVSGNNGTAENVIDKGATGSAHVTSGATGKYGEALSFDRNNNASNRAVQYGDVHDIGTGSYTVALWFNTYNTSTAQALAAKGQSGGSSSEGWTIFIENNTIITRLGGGTSANRASQNISIAGLADSWHHLAFVVDNTAGTVTGYLDGSNTGWTNGGGGPGGNTFTAGTDIDVTDDLRLGIAGNGGLEFRGELDDFKIYNEALDSAGVAAAMIPEPATLGIIAVFGGVMLFVRRKLML